MTKKVMIVNSTTATIIKSLAILRLYAFEVLRESMMLSY
jgi:hypothetical protein